MGVKNNRDSESIIRCIATETILVPADMSSKNYGRDTIQVSSLSIRSVHWCGTWVIESYGPVANSVAGTVAVAANSKNVVGTGTNFDTALANGNMIRIGAEVFVINTISNADHLTVSNVAVIAHTNAVVTKSNNTVELNLTGTGSWLLDGCIQYLSGADALKLTLTGTGSIVLKVGKN